MKMKSGLIGVPTIFRSQTCDKYNEGGFFMAYSAMSGGIFVDMAIHDVDLSLWFFGEEQLFSDRPPRVMDFLNNNLVLRYERKALHKVIRIRVEESLQAFDETDEVLGE